VTAPGQEAAHFVTRKELAAALGVSLDTVHRLTHSGDIPYLRRGRLYRYNIAEVREALRPQVIDSWARPSRRKKRGT
jgi:excisionase family DNA binding protein